MSEDMPSSWRYLNSASSRFSSFRGYLHREQKNQTPTNGLPDEQQGWRVWAGQKMKFRRGTSDTDSSGMHTVTLFPGWAARRYRKVGSNELDGALLLLSANRNQLTVGLLHQRPLKWKFSFLGLRRATVKLPVVHSGRSYDSRKVNRELYFSSMNVWY
jgi:hypothetical protein